MKIGIVLGSVREDRFGAGVGRWAQEQTADRLPTYEVVDLKHYGVPILTSASVPMAEGKCYDDDRVQAWSDLLDQVEDMAARLRSS